MVQIGRPSQSRVAHAPDFTDPLGLLVHCHVKIELQLEALERAVRMLANDDGEAIPFAIAIIAAARAHFSGPAVRHTADEEVSLFPRLRRFASDSDSGLIAALRELESQHRCLDAVHAKFDELIDTAGPEPESGQLDVDDLELTVGELLGVYRPHFQMENEIIFPEAARILSPAEILAVGQEMRARRGLPAIGQ
jgi:pyridoxamine 5'-phosphate oxidase